MFRVTFDVGDNGRAVVLRFFKSERRLLTALKADREHAPR